MTDRFVADTERPSVSYGPRSDTLGDGYVLSVSTADDGRVEIVFDDQPMYDLWTEVKGVPWPEREQYDRKDRLVRQVVHAANGADEASLKDALEALGVGDV